MEEIKEKMADEVMKALERWKDEEGNLIMVFHAIQKHYGYVPRNIAMEVGDYLGIPLAKIYEVVTFYNYFNLEPPAKYTIAVCTGTACYLKGADSIIAEFKKKLGVDDKAKYSDDKMYKVDEVRCIGCCGLAPVITVNGEVFGKVKPEMVDDILKEAGVETPQTV